MGIFSGESRCGQAVITRKATLEAEDKWLAEAYISASRPFERSLFIDLKNHFKNCAATSEYVWSKLLHGDCTDEQMYAYSYEENMKE